MYVQVLKLLKRGGKAVQRRLFDDMTLEYFMPRSVVSSRGLYTCIQN